MTPLEMQKMAEAVRQELSEHPLSVLGKSVLGFGVGAGLGYGAGMGLDRLTGRAITPSMAAKALPIVGGAVGLTAPHFFQMTQRKAHEAHLKRQEAKSERPRT